SACCTSPASTRSWGSLRLSARPWRRRQIGLTYPTVEHVDDRLKLAALVRREAAVGAHGALVDGTHRRHLVRSPRGRKRLHLAELLIELRGKVFHRVPAL